MRIEGTVLGLTVAAALVVCGAGCESETYPEPTEHYSSVGGFELRPAPGMSYPGYDYDVPYSIGTAERGMWHPYSIAVDEEGRLFVANINGGYIERFLPQSDGSAVWDAYWVWPRGRKESTYQLYLDTFVNQEGEELLLVSEAQEEELYPGTWQGRRVWKVRLPQDLVDSPGDDRPTHADITSDDLLYSWFPYGREQPGPVSSRPDRELVFVDINTGYLFNYRSNDFTELAKGAGLGDEYGLLRLPLGLEVTPSGDVAVSDTYHHRVQIFELVPTPTDPTDPDYIEDYTQPYIFRFKQIIGEFGYGNGQFSTPTGLECDADGNIYVCDTRNARIQKFDAQGNLLAVIYGSGYWRLRCPLDIAVTPEGDLWVVDAYLWYEPWGDDLIPPDQARIILFQQD